MLDKAPSYFDVYLLINGCWRPAENGDTMAIVNPATGETIGRHAHAR